VAPRDVAAWAASRNDLALIDAVLDAGADIEREGSSKPRLTLTAVATIFYA
jgi:hypothetical protein